MSASVRFATPETLKSGASTTVTGGPSFGLTTRFWPSSFSIVPRTGIGVPSGGAWATAEAPISIRNAAAKAAGRVTENSGSRLISIVPSSKQRLHAVLLRRDARRRQAAVRLLERDREDRRTGLQHGGIARDIAEYVAFRFDDERPLMIVEFRLDG